METKEVTVGGRPVSQLSREELLRLVARLAETFEFQEVDEATASLSGTNPSLSAAFWRKVAR